ncbi:MAG: tRNA dimethylallyltransferase [Parcubacteria group bacterium GW2011_GWB1_46_8]|nr:MAG: tRNA dimethylallyltransferase [Parcubacteria group bacterium GW2011_GWF1_45_5]KKU43437.1 MAG: tRNA dimethylallyltransferase [Parcubacteria group bacterium GW2011_GWA2_46_7]KKU46488.1 MAG: tRNA dimethylallyltransferase [Parcubacteria group bacterium GW2011_GWB1_46_8]KKU47045.1 MAG: tRNA dimethylallyltransferase [Parcubacteria group bacterium GW2011_GWF2_46_8]
MRTQKSTNGESVPACYNAPIFPMTRKNKKPIKIVCVVGPTSSGKTDFGIRLARAFNGEIVSADSRQVYRGFDLCSGKVTKKEMKAIPHYLLNIASPRKTFSVSQYVALANKAVRTIAQKNKIPFIVGGTGFYIDALTEGLIIPEVKPNRALRDKLEQKTTKELFRLLKQKDPQRAKTIDSYNPRRLVRALEIVDALGKVPKQKKLSPYETLYIGLRPKENILKKRIHNRLIVRLKRGMIREIKNLHEKERLSWKRLKSFGLELKYASLYLQGKLTHQEMKEQLEYAIFQYAKRQMTWFKRNQDIHWVMTYTQAKKLVKEFIQIQ